MRETVLSGLHVERVNDLAAAAFFRLTAAPIIHQGVSQGSEEKCAKAAALRGEASEGSSFDQAGQELLRAIFRLVM
jgi:hypothetical protein